MKHREAYLCRLDFQDADGDAVWKVRGRYVDRTRETTPVNVAMGMLGPCVSPYELPLPACPDCGDEIVWAEAGYVPGARQCTGCGSMFSVETRPARVTTHHCSECGEQVTEFCAEHPNATVDSILAEDVP